MKKNIVIISIFLIGCLIIFMYFNNSNVSKFEDKEIIYEMNLLGNEKIINYLGEVYTEPGYEIYDNNGNYYNNKVNIRGNVDINKEGIYEILYIFEEILKKDMFM